LSIGMRIAALCSGGKDSAYALWLSIKQGHEVAYIVAMIPAREDSWMFHQSNIHLIDLFAECAGLPLVKAETSGEKDSEIDDLKRTLKTLDVEGIVSGGIASNYQKSRIDEICRDLGLNHLAPLWGKEQAKLLQEMIDAQFEIIFTSVSAQGLGESWLGRKLDEGSLRDLITLNQRYKVNVSGEGGEYESLVLDAPFFSKRIAILEAKRVWKGDCGHLLISKAEIKDKSG
jgi:diphthine-ammonia ligase